MRKLLLGCALGVIGVSGIACRGGATEIFCTAEFRYGMTIYVRDSVSGADLAAGSTVVVRDGSFVDSLTTPFPASGSTGGTFASAGERAGTYTVTVRRAGYQTWTKSGVVVTGGVCHVNHTDVIARLQP